MKKKKQDNPEENKQIRRKRQPENQGKLLLDATVADQMIAYPTDLGLVNGCREESERIIDVLCYTVEYQPEASYLSQKCT